MRDYAAGASCSGSEAIDWHRTFCAQRK